MGGHFERVAAVYESLRTTDEAPVRAICQLLPDRPVTGLDTGCGTGRYTRLLRALLPDGSRLAASDVSAAMLAQLDAAGRGHAGGVVPLLAAAEQLPLRAASLDLVTAFNCVHHFDLGRFLAAAARVLKPGGQLFVSTGTRRQNARTISRRYFPGFTEHEQRLHSQAAIRDAVQPNRRAHDDHSPDLRPSAHEHGRAAPGPGRGMPLLDLLPLHPRRAARVHHGLPGPPAQRRGLLGGRAPPDRRRRKPLRPGASQTARAAGRARRSRGRPPDQRRARRPGSPQASRRPASCTRPGLTPPSPASPRKDQAPARPRRPHQRIRASRLKGLASNYGQVLAPHRRKNDRHRSPCRH